MAGWIKQGDIPKKQRLSVIVDSSENPELAHFLFCLPYGTVNKTVKQLLDLGMRNFPGAGSSPELTVPANAVSPSGEDTLSETPIPVTTKDAPAISPPLRARLEQNPASLATVVRTASSESFRHLSNNTQAGPSNPVDEIDAATARLILEMDS